MKEVEVEVEVKMGVKNRHTAEESRRKENSREGRGKRRGV